MKQKTLLLLMAVASLVLSGCATIRSDYKAAREINTVESYEEFLAKHTDSEYEQKVKEIIEQLEWQKAKSSNTIESYQKYISKYPSGRFETEAESCIEKLYWEKAEKKNSISSYKKYLNKYPKGQFNKYANAKLQKLELEKAKKVNSVFSYKEYKKQYPNTKYSKELNRQINLLRSNCNPSLKNIETVFIEIESSFPKGYNLPQSIKSNMKEQIKELLNLVLIEVVRERNNADAIIKININGKALGKYYNVVNYSTHDIINTGKTEFHYANAVVSGEIDLIRKENKSYRICSFYKKILRSKIQDDYKEPKDAPLKSAFYKTKYYRKIYLFLKRNCNILPNVKCILKTNGYPKLSNYGHTVYVSSSDYIYAFDTNNNTLKWKYKKYDLGTVPTIADGLLYVGIRGDDCLYALDIENGSIKWKFEAKNRVDYIDIRSRVMILNGMVYLIGIKSKIGKEDEYIIFALDAKYGYLKWKFKTKGRINSPLVVRDGLVYITARSEDCIYALDTNKGSIKWKFNTKGNIVSTTLGNGLIYLGSKADNCIYALDANNGNLKWKFEKKGKGNIARLAIGDGLLFVGSRLDDNFYALDARNGSLKWNFNKRIYPYSHRTYIKAIFPIGNTTYVVRSYSVDHDLWKSRKRPIYIYALDSHNGLLKWKYRVKGIIDSKPIISNNTLYLCTHNLIKGGNYLEYVYSIDLIGGTLNWKYLKNEGTTHRHYGNFVVLDGKVCVGAGDKCVYIIN